MIFDDEIEPDIIFANQVLKGCVKKGDILLANKVISDIICKFNLNKDESTFVYLLLINANNGDINGVESIWEELEESNVDISDVLFGAMYKAMSILVRIDKLIEYREIAYKVYGFPLRVIDYITFMKTCLVTKDIQSGIKFAEKAISDYPVSAVKDKTFLSVMQQLYLQLLISEKDEIKRNEYYKKIVDEIPDQLRKNGNEKITHTSLSAMITATLLMNLQSQWSTTADKIEKWIIDNNYGHWKLDKNRKKMVIDIHGLASLDALFRIRLIFAKEKNKVLEYLENNDTLSIVTGVDSKRQDIKNGWTELSDGENMSVEEIIVNDLKCVGVGYSVFW